MNENPEILDVAGEPFTEMDEFWLEMARNIAKDSIGALEDAAKQLISIVTLIEGIYFAAISFSDVRKDLASAGQPWLVIILIISPVVLWLICLVFAIKVFNPVSYPTNLNSSTLAEKTYKQIVGFKYKMLRRAHISLLIGFIPFVIAIVYYLTLPVAPT
jgi:hypothetical protein